MHVASVVPVVFGVASVARAGIDGTGLDAELQVMVVRTVWPGAPANEVAKQVTERIEKALMTTGNYEFIRSYSRPGESQVIFVARD